MTDTASLEKTLQATLDRLVESRLGSLRQELSRELRGEISAALGSFKTGSSAATAAIPAMPPAANTVSELNQAIARLLQPTGQTEVMGACLQSAAGFAGRCALFVRRGDAFAFWRAERFREDATASLRSLSIPANQEGIFKDLMDTQRALWRARATGVIPAIVDRALGDCVEGNFYLLPIVVQGRIVAALFADAGTVAGSVDAAALEILTKVTGLSLETATARVATAGTRVPVAAAAEAVPTKTDGEETSQPSGSSGEVLEAVTVEAQAPPPGSFAASIPATPEAAPSVTPPPDAGSLPETEREAHRKAHRFARVAVQDLLSYHKNKIEQGRKNKNLYMMLKEDIEKTRENYRQRFGNTPARSFDYLHYELVLKLAGNDPEALGAQYPGALQGE